MFVDVVPEGAATGALADYYRQQREAWGFLPNYAAAFSTRPAVAQAWNTLDATVRDGMDRRRFEIATIAAARALRSTYCTAAHSKFLRDVCGDEATMLSIATEPSGAALSPQDRAVYEFAAKVACRRGLDRASGRGPAAGRRLVRRRHRRRGVRCRCPVILHARARWTGRAAGRSDRPDLPT